MQTTLKLTEACMEEIKNPTHSPRLMQIQVVQKSTASRPRDMWPLCMRTLSSFELGPLKNQDMYTDIYRFLLNFGDKQIICAKLCELWLMQLFPRTKN